MFSSNNQEDVKDYSVYTFESEEEVEKETYSMIPMYKNKDTTTSWVILRVKLEDIEGMKPFILDRLIPNLDKYKHETNFGFGLETFQKDIIEYYKTKPTYSYIELLIDNSNILNTTTTDGFERLKNNIQRVTIKRYCMRKR